MAESTTTTSRRQILTVAAVAAAVAPLGKAAAAETPDWLTIIEQSLDRAQSAVDAHCFMHRDNDTLLISEEYDRLYDRYHDILDHILWMQATDIRSFRLKAKAVFACNQKLSHLRSDSLDTQLTRSIIAQLLGAPAI